MSSDEHNLKIAIERHSARLAAVQALHQMDMTGAGLKAILAEYLDGRVGFDEDGNPLPKVDSRLFSQILEATVTYQIDIDKMLDNNLAKGWRLSRLNSTSRAILRAGICELHFDAGLAHGIVLDEYVSIARAFFDEDETGFINGILDKVARLQV